MLVRCQCDNCFQPIAFEAIDAGSLLYSYGANPNATMGPGLSWREVADAFAKAGVVSMSLCQK
jgi:hypothetical protein